MAGSGERLRLNRRAFLRLASAAVVPLIAPKLAKAAPIPSDQRLTSSTASLATTAPPAPLGRIATWWRQALRAEPAPNAELLAWKSRDDLVPLTAAVHGEPPWPTNPIWYQTEEGYIHSGYVQPVRDEPQPVVEEVTDPGFWAEVSVPWADARWTPGSGYRAFRFYHGTVYRVIAVVQDEEGNSWYRLKEGVNPWRPGPYVPAHTLRPISPDELTPLSPGIGDKRIIIDRQAQSLSCLEGDQTVFTTRISTGHASTPTPRGEFRVLYKRHTRRMTVSDIAEPYDLPGVPFTVYFTWSGVAIHGTYWHNDYGRVHSHGCVNATPEAARWIFRWADPVVPYAEYTARAEPPSVGTPVFVV